MAFATGVVRTWGRSDTSRRVHEFGTRAGVCLFSSDVLFRSGEIAVFLLRFLFRQTAELWRTSAPKLSLLPPFGLPAVAVDWLVGNGEAPLPSAPRRRVLPVEEDSTSIVAGLIE
jgi:hypothetical protein